jgi:hypothetical protein
MINKYDAQERQHGIWEILSINGTPYWRGYLHHGTLKGVSKGWNTKGEVTTKTYHLVIR